MTDHIQSTSAFGRFPTILPCKGRWLAEGQTEGYLPLDRAAPLHHFVVPLPLQGRILQPHLVGSSPIAFLLSSFLFHMRRWNAAPFPASTAAAHATLSRRCPFPVASLSRRRRGTGA
ncbi:hypothetical protein E5554_07850 [Sphingobium sp. PAMC28499]|nr:hypothetical protein E5554_07850 [Sphingobium sp. PAMC28499]